MKIMGLWPSLISINGTITVFLSPNIQFLSIIRVVFGRDYHILEPTLRATATHEPYILH